MRLLFDRCQLGNKEMACLGACTWPLECLSLFQLWPDNLALAFLSSGISSGSWPNLKKLDLSNNNVSLFAVAIAQLTKGRWPLLEQLCLCGNRFHSRSVLNELKKGDWLLPRTLQLDCNPLPSTSAADLIQGKWPLLQKLAVSFRDLDRSVGGTLTRGNWPVLHELQLSDA